MNQHLTQHNNENESTVISIPQESIHFFKETGRWAKLLAILGFVFIGFMVVAAFTMGTIMTAFGGEVGQFPFQGILMGAIYLFVALLYYFPVMYLFKFSKNIKQAFITMDSTSFNAAIGSLKSHYKFIGVLTIIMMAFYAMMLFGLVVMAIAM
ncbi:hypothetical protein BC962_1768 [Gillisia mitskevichiae]|uniref:DUF5362 domain-containing protein n=1 Tax=Gillisia mitskevichiae TaxID=270921 RepID=A0A495PU72_9FLAO|nr:hypothetical protein [Gillisia mitskevichiae]RKS53516.1 hypothetical protein BC962_1768 [Gillisia mitskevichiae]